MKTVFRHLLILLCLTAATLPLQAQSFDEDHKENINGTLLHFRVRGSDRSRPYLVILHGGPGFSAHMFYHWGAGLEAFLNVVYLDQRGSGESAHLSIAKFDRPQPEEVKDYTIPNLLKDIEGVRAFLKVRQWWVLGHSWGGMLGLEYVTAYPGSVLGYVHMDGLLSQPMAQNSVLDHAQAKFEAAAAGADKTRAEQAVAMLAKVKAVRAMPPGPDRMFGAFQLIYLMFAELYYAKPADMAVMNQQLAETTTRYHVPRAALSANEPAIALIQTEHYATRDDTPLLDKVTVRTLILNGKQDGLISPKMAELAHSRIKGSTVVLLDGSGHFPFMEQPDKTTEAIRAFVDPPRK